MNSLVVGVIYYKQLEKGQTVMANQMSSPPLLEKQMSGGGAEISERQSESP